MNIIVNAVVAVVVIAAYVTLTVTGHDGTLLLGVLIGQGVTPVIKTVAPSGSDGGR